jgi:Uma2 family endonuclease
MHYYAAAGIAWYLLIDQKTTEMQLFRLAGDTYVEHSTARPGEILRLREPVVVNLDPAELSLPA